MLSLCKKNLKLTFLGVVMLIETFTIRAETLPQVHLQIGMHVIQAEVAANNETRMKGLMYRKSLQKNQGMLFVFDRSDRHSMWMKNTPLPLSVAFLDDKGVIVNIEEMKPFTDVTHTATKPARYALEMSEGWFKQRGIKAGDTVLNLMPIN
jgi:hypothetical protein